MRWMVPKINSIQKEFRRIRRTTIVILTDWLARIRSVGLDVLET